jgi:hypothetical protein
MQTETENRSQYVALARSCCPKCQGTGLDGKETCSCVWRKVFRIVMRKVQDIETGRHLMRPINTLGVSQPSGRKSDKHRQSDYACDVYLTAKRTLTDPIEWAIFRNYYQLGADWNLCAKRVGLPYQENRHKRMFYYRCYCIEAKLGEIFSTLAPYPLHPCDSYFTTGHARAQAIPVAEPRYPNGVPLRPPMLPAPAKPDPLVAIKEEVVARFKQGETFQVIADDLNARRIRPQRADSWTRAMVSHITGHRAHRAYWAAPARPVHVVPFDVNDETAAGRACRTWYSSGRTIKKISEELKSLGGTQYTIQRVTRLLIANPAMKKAA